MLFKTPTLLSAELDVIEKINAMRHTLRHAISASRRWAGTLRRATLARNIRHSNSIEGINVTRDDALAAVDYDEPLTAEKSAWQATIGYRNAMTYALQLADDPHFSYSEGLIRSLHFMMIQHDFARRPGLYRTGLIFIHDDKKQETVYEGPAPEEVPGLMSELVQSLNEPSDVPAMIRAAMGHLNLVMIHPFADGNGRMARCLQTLILGREQIVQQPFCSIEEYLGRYTHEYYDVLAQVGKGAFHPQNDCRAWVRFNLVAHFRQASWLLQRSRMTQRIWNEVEQLAARKGVNERGLSTLVDAACGFKIRRNHYLNAAQVSEQVASRDLKIMVDHGLLIGEGETRGRTYRASPLLEEIYSRHYETRTSADPFTPQPLTMPA
ncbi:MAG: Fic family protein [Acidobacteriia bacterium]|nr:Fic family protein [Terriglobia bacterium]